MAEHTTTPALILTGCNERYARTLWQMLASARRSGLPEHHQLHVYDLGMSAASRERIARHFPFAPITAFDFSAAPGHAATLAGFAWKPLIIAAAATEWQGPLFWFDSATVFRGPLDIPLRSIAESGFWTLKGQTPLKGRADPRVIAALDLPPDILNLPERVAGACGFDTAAPIPRRFIDRWAELARDPDLILPEAPDPAHRFDQTLFTALLLSAQWRGEITLGDEEVDISSIAPIRYLTTRNKLPPNLPLWLDPAARAYWRLWKAMDRLGLRLEKRLARSRSG